MPSYILRVLLARLLYIVSGVITFVTIYKIREKLEEKKYGTEIRISKDRRKHG